MLICNFFLLIYQMPLTLIPFS